MKQFLNKISELIIFSILFIFPFSNGDITTKWVILFIPLIISLVILQIFLIKNRFNTNRLSVVFAVMLMIIFDFSEKINFIQQFNLGVEFSYRISLTTILLSIGFLLFLMKVLINKKITNISHPFALYFLFTGAFLLVLMTLFYPYLWYHYQMNLDSNFHLLNRIIKYIIILLLVPNYITDTNKLKQMNLGIIVSISITVILSILL